MCSILPDCKRWAQFDAYIQYMHYTDHYNLCNICKYDINVTYTFTLTKKVCQESLKLSSNSNCTSLALRLASEGIFCKWWFHNAFSYLCGSHETCLWMYSWWFQKACFIFTIPPPLCSGRPISTTFMVSVICKSIASQSINTADTRPHWTTPD